MNIIKCILYAALAITLVAGCGMQPTRTWIPVSPPTGKQAEELSKYLAGGASGIQGQVFMKTRGGYVKYGSGSDVMLLPFEAEMLAKAGEPFNVREDPTISKYARHTTADATGNFEFSGLREGRYLVESYVYWEVPEYHRLNTSTGGYTHMEGQGGRLNTYVDVEAGKITKVVLTD